MARSIHCKRVSHFNLILEDYEASMAHLRELYGAELLHDMPKPHWHACLIEIGGVIIELFSPEAFLLNARHGPHFLGVEYQADMDEVRAAIADHGVRIIRDLKVACHTNPQDCLGADLEFYSGSFHDNDPPHLTRTIRPAAYWRDEHPLGLTGLKAYTLGVSDLAAATGFIESFLSGEVVYREERAAIGARVVGLQVADAVVELMTPAGDGPVRRELERVGQGIHSTVFRVKDLEQARRYFAGRGVDIVQGSAPDRICVPAEANRGVVFEFSE
jgi:hypothetical protein